MFGREKIKVSHSIMAAVGFMRRAAELILSSPLEISQIAVIAENLPYSDIYVAGTEHRRIKVDFWARDSRYSTSSESKHVIGLVTVIRGPADSWHIEEFGSVIKIMGQLDVIQPPTALQSVDEIYGRRDMPRLVIDKGLIRCATETELSPIR
ncbi:MAG: hypothetical protein Q8Q22_01495 [bacterium]|nr:hypothetical protein [bacterium]